MKPMLNPATLFLALGPAPTQRELELVAQALRDSEDDEALAALAVATGDREACDARAGA
jgi:hypothetical protein